MRGALRSLPILVLTAVLAFGAGDAFARADAASGPRTAGAGSPAAGGGNGAVGDLTEGVNDVALEASTHLVRVIRALEWPGHEAEHAGPSRIIGTGVSLGGGRIITGAGVVGPATEVLVVADRGDTVLARVTGVDRRTNVAVLESPGLSLPAMPLADDVLLFPGDLVIAVGLGAPGYPEASFGTVVLVDGPSLGYSEVDMVQVTAPVFPGYTGGALLTRDGRMVGLVSGRVEMDPARAILPEGTDLVAGWIMRGRLATTAPTAATVALPIQHALEIAGELARLGYVERGYFGLQVELIDRSRDRGIRGVLVHRVVEDSPAGRADIIPGDVILEYAGARVQSPEDLSFLVAATVPGADVPVRYLRRGIRRMAYVTIEQAPDLEWTASMDAVLARRSSGGGVAPLAR